MLLDKLLKEIVPTKRSQEIEVPNPIYPILFTMDGVPGGATYECLRNPRKMREPLIRKLKLGDQVTFDKGKWQNETLLLVINKQGLDVGSFSNAFYGYLTDMVKNLQISGTVQQKDPLVLNMEIHGEYKKKWDIVDPVPGPKGKEYTYVVTVDDEYMRLPVSEIPCQLVLVEDTYIVKAAGKMVGTINPKKTEKLQGMLDKYECTTTVHLSPHNYDGTVLMTLRF